MLAKKNRLNLFLPKNKNMFYFGQSQRFVANNLLFIYRPNKCCLRVAAIAPSRLFLKAHQRNKLRRQIYNMINQQVKMIKKTKKTNLLQERLDLIVVYKKKDFEVENLKKDFLDFFNKTLLKNNEAL